MNIYTQSLSILFGIQIAFASNYINSVEEIRKLLLQREFSRASSTAMNLNQDLRAKVPDAKAEQIKSDVVAITRTHRLPDYTITLAELDGALSRSDFESAYRHSLFLMASAMGMAIRDLPPPAQALTAARERAEHGGSFGEYFAWAGAALYAKQPSEALTASSKALEAWPSHPLSRHSFDMLHNLHQMRTRAYLDLGDLPRAEASLLASLDNQNLAWIIPFPELIAARRLLAMNQRSIVLAYLEKAVPHFPANRDRLQGWIEELKLGKTPALREPAPR